MGMLSWLTATEKKHQEVVPKQFSVPYVSPVKVLDISEPVQSLLESLNRDEWELICNFNYGYESLYLHHVYNENLMLRINAGSYVSDYRYRISCNWMTLDEQDAVNLIIDSVIQNINNRNRDYRNQIERDKFMVLVKTEAV